MADTSLLPLVGSDPHRALAREAVSQSLVLLVNQGGLLPITEATETIFVGGQAADDIGIQSGGWTIEWQGAEGAITPGTTLLEGLEDVAPDGTEVYFNANGDVSGVLRDDGTALDPDLCLAVVGERPYAEGVGDSAELAIVDADLDVLENMSAGCSSLAVVLLSGRPLVITPWMDDWDALVAAWLPGTEGGGVADVLFGAAPFSGKLPFTWPRSVDQLPFDFVTLGTGADAPLFPYGYGLE